jgi:hypothetical protein
MVYVCFALFLSVCVIYLFRIEELKHRAAVTIPVGAARFFLLLLIKSALVPIGPELDAWYPRRGPPHLLTDRIQ